MALVFAKIVCLGSAATENEISVFKSLVANAFPNLAAFGVHPRHVNIQTHVSDWLSALHCGSMCRKAVLALSLAQGPAWKGHFPKPPEDITIIPQFDAAEMIF